MNLVSGLLAFDTDQSGTTWTVDLVMNGVEMARRNEGRTCRYGAVERIRRAELVVAALVDFELRVLQNTVSYVEMHDAAATTCRHPLVIANSKSKLSFDAASTPR